MGFATSLQALTRLTLKGQPATLSLNPNFSSDDASEAAAEPVSFTTNRPKAKQISIPCHARQPRPQSSRQQYALSSGLCSDTRAAIANNRRVEQAASPRLLKIVQREPQQPECLLICGRMADVCAALERMALHEQTAPQV
jgi:hypothetical protein